MDFRPVAQELKLNRNAPNLLFALLLVAMAMSLGSCSSDDGLRRYARELPAAWIDALEASDAEFEDFARAQGAHFVLLVESHLNFAYDLSSLEAYESSAEVLDAPSLRLTRVLAEEYGFERKWLLRQELDALPRAESLALRRRIEEAYAIDADPSLAAATKAEAIVRILDELDEVQAPIKRSHLAIRASTHSGSAGDLNAQRQLLDRAIRMSEELGEPRMRCQALGVRGSLSDLQDGSLEDLADWNEGLELALEHKMAGQAGRFLLFLSHHYESLGHLALARDLRREAEEVCQSLGGASTEIRFYIDWLDFHADLGCWEIVDRDLPRAPVVLDHFETWVEARYVQQRKARIKWIQARRQMADGKIREANSLFQEVEDSLLDLGYHGELTRVRLSWARGLLDAGEIEGVQQILHSALEYVEHDPVHAKLLITDAEALARLEQWRDCRHQLNAFRSLAAELDDALFAEWTLHDALLIRTARVLDDAAALQGTIDYTLARLETRLRSLEDIQEGHLILQETQPIREELHAVLVDRPKLGYQLELEWRRIPELLGHPQGDGPDGAVLAACSELVAAALGDSDPTALALPGSTAPSATMHLLYRVRARSLQRWTLGGNGLSYQTVPVGERELQDRVNGILNTVGRHPESSHLSESMARELHELARLLLPDPLLEPDQHASNSNDPRVLFLTLDGPLVALPFAILNLSADGYSPLIGSVDPVLLAGAAAVPHRSRDEEFVVSRSPGAGLIVADPRSGPGFLEGAVGLPPLERGIEEARALKEWRPESSLLERDAATKAAIQERWEDASFLYFASHLILDPEAPYLSYLPLSPPQSNGPVRREDAYLDMLDVGAASLKARPLVVLSACSSGAPYVVRGSVAPGLGDAFLRAGASAVIHTYWSVHDDATASLMHNTMRAWALEGEGPAPALHAARRRMASEGPYTHPYFWGSTVITVRVGHHGTLGKLADVDR